MPNRILKESICTSPTLEKLEPMEECFWYRLMVACDDYGRFDARPPILRARCFPLKLDTVKDADITRWLARFVEVGLLILYAVEGQPYLELATWGKHQQVRAQRSKFPAPASADEDSDITCNQLISDASTCPRNPIQSESNPNPNPNPIAVADAPARERRPRAQSAEKKETHGPQLAAMAEECGTPLSTMPKTAVGILARQAIEAMKVGWSSDDIHFIAQRFRTEHPGFAVSGPVILRHGAQILACKDLPPRTNGCARPNAQNGNGGVKNDDSQRQPRRYEKLGLILENGIPVGEGA